MQQQGLGTRSPRAAALASAALHDLAECRNQDVDILRQELDDRRAALDRQAHSARHNARHYQAESLLALRQRIMQAEQEMLASTSRFYAVLEEQMLLEEQDAARAEARFAEEAKQLRMQHRWQVFAHHVADETNGMVRMAVLEPQDSSYRRVAQAVAANALDVGFSVRVQAVFHIAHARRHQAWMQAVQRQDSSRVKVLFCLVPHTVLPRIITHGFGDLPDDDAEQAPSMFRRFWDLPCGPEGDIADEDASEKNGSKAQAYVVRDEVAGIAPVDAASVAFTRTSTQTSESADAAAGRAPSTVLLLCRVILGNIAQLDDDESNGADEAARIQDALQTHDSVYLRRSGEFRVARSAYILPEFVVLRMYHQPEQPLAGLVQRPQRLPTSLLFADHSLTPRRRQSVDAARDEPTSHVAPQRFRDVASVHAQRLRNALRQSVVDSQNQMACWQADRDAQQRSSQVDACKQAARDNRRVVDRLRAQLSAQQQVTSVLAGTLDAALATQSVTSLRGHSSSSVLLQASSSTSSLRGRPVASSRGHRTASPTLPASAGSSSASTASVSPSVSSRGSTASRSPETRARVGVRPSTSPAPTRAAAAAAAAAASSSASLAILPGLRRRSSRRGSVSGIAAAVMPGRVFGFQAPTFSSARKSDAT